MRPTRERSRRVVEGGRSDGRGGAASPGFGCPLRSREGWRPLSLLHARVCRVHVRACGCAVCPRVHVCARTCRDAETRPGCPGRISQSTRLNGLCTVGRLAFPFIYLTLLYFVRKGVSRCRLSVNQGSRKSNGPNPFRSLLPLSCIPTQLFRPRCLVSLEEHNGGWGVGDPCGRTEGTLVVAVGTGDML